MQARRTLQKQAVLAVFENTKRPLTVPEIHEFALKSCEGLGVATVYRAVNRLVEKEWLKEVNLPGQPTRYERQSLEHHHHFHCTNCERVLDISAPCENLTSYLPPNFTATHHEVTFYGTCASCGTAVEERAPEASP